MTLISEAHTKEEAQRIYDELCEWVSEETQSVIARVWEEHWRIVNDLQIELAKKLQELEEKA